MIRQGRSAALKRLAWRLGRRIYLGARGEQRSGSMPRNGESFLQQCVVRASDPKQRLVALDIGANVGEWTKSLLGQLPSERRLPERLAVHAFEPVPSTAQILRAKLEALSGGSCVTLHECALSSEPGIAEMAVFFAGAGINSLHFDGKDTAPQSVVKVPVTTLTEFCSSEGLAHIHLAKCDTEGNDARVLAGATPLLRAGAIDVIQFEYNHRWVFGRSFLKDVFELVDGLPYAVARVDPDHLTLFQEWHPELERFFQSNYALVSEAAVEWFPIVRGHFDAANTYA